MPTAPKSEPCPAPAPSLHFVHDENYAEAVANTTHKVYGRTLRPYCLWHRLQLELAQSPILLGLAVTPLDLWRAACICSSRWSIDGRTPDTRPPSFLRFVWLAWRFPFSKQAAAFQTYLNDYSRGPKLWPSVGKGQTKERDIDETLETVCYLLARSNLTLSEIWTMPVGMLSWYTLGIQRAHGAELPVWTPEHQAAFDAHKAEREARLDQEAVELRRSHPELTAEQASKQVRDAYWASVRANLDSSSPS